MAASLGRSDQKGAVWRVAPDMCVDISEIPKLPSLAIHLTAVSRSIGHPDFLYRSSATKSTLVAGIARHHLKIVFGMNLSPEAVYRIEPHREVDVELHVLLATNERWIPLHLGQELQFDNLQIRCSGMQKQGRCDR